MSGPWKLSSLALAMALLAFVMAWLWWPKPGEGRRLDSVSIPHAIRPPARPPEAGAARASRGGVDGEGAARRQRGVDSDEAGEAGGDTAILNRLRELGSSQPRVSLDLARLGNDLYPNAGGAAERGWFEARALVNLERFADAEAVARRIKERYPGTRWARDLERHLLTHPFGLPSQAH